MDFSKAGAKDAVIRFLTVLFYIALSGAITSLIAYFTDLQASNGQWYAILAVVNAVLAALQKWVTTKSK